MKIESELQESLTYLASDQALRSLETEAYWPKSDSPWWHMLLLHEMGETKRNETKRIPAAAIKTYIATLDRMPLKIFPIHPEDMPTGVNPYRECPCHCQLGNVYQVLAAWGVDVDKELPWIRKSLSHMSFKEGSVSGKRVLCLASITGSV